MYIYNVTINIDESQHESWLSWMQEIHIPDMLATGKFTEARMCRVMVEEELGGITYAIQYMCPDKETLQRYFDEDAARLRQDGIDRFGDQFVAFRTEMQLISEQKTESLAATEFLFTYGTLQDVSIQYAVYSRKLSGNKDRLHGFKISEKKVAGAYPVVIQSEDQDDTVEGIVYMLTNKELLMTDAYEGAAYERVKVTLESGTESWVYTRRNGSNPYF